MTETRRDYGRVNPAPAVGGGQWLVLAVGIAYSALGVAGLVASGTEGFASDRGHELLGLETNGLHSLVHLGVGAAGLVAWRRPGAAAGFGWALLGAFAGLFVYGLFAAGQDWDLLAVNPADNLLHLGTAVVGAAVVGTTAAARRRPGPLRY